MELHRVLLVIEFMLELEDKDTTSLTLLRKFDSVRAWRTKMRQTWRKFLDEMASSKAPESWGCCQSGNSPEIQCGQFLLSQNLGCHLGLSATNLINSVS